MKKLLVIPVLLLSIFIGIQIAAADWSGSPTAPQPVAQHSDYANWSFASDAVGPETWYNPIYPIQAEHGADCSAPPATHVVNTYEDRIYICSNHIMTSMNAGGGFEQAIMTPNRVFDFCAGPINIDFDLSTFRNNSRDWVDVLVQPFAGNVSSPDENMGAFPAMGILARQEGSFHLHTIRNHVATKISGSYAPFGTGIVGGTNQAATRQPFRFTVSRTSASMTRLASTTGNTQVSFNSTFPDIGFCQGTVSFLHVDYDPLKGEGGMNGSTWHWGFDSTKWTASTPFVSIKATSRFANPTTPNVHFVAPAPANSYLRFNGAGCGTAQVSFNAGASWVDPVTSHTPYCEVQNYFTPIPAGTQDIRVRWTTGGNHIARDFSIWSQSAAASTPTPTATVAPPVATPTSPLSTPTIAPTATTTAIPSATVQATATSSPTSMATAVPTSTPSPSPASLSDEFNSLNTNTWAVLDRWGEGSDQMCWKPSQVSVSGGMLNLTAIQASTTCPNPPSSGGGIVTKPYASGEVMWRAPLVFQTGSIEVRAKMPSASGLVSAIWFVGAGVNNDCQIGHVTDPNPPACHWPTPPTDEVDMAEFLFHDLTHVNQQVHNGASNAGCNPAVTDASANFHVYKLDRTATSLVFSVDGVATCTLTGAAVTTSPLFLILQNAVNPDFGGALSGGFPSTMQVDYVRVTGGTPATPTPMPPTATPVVHTYTCFVDGVQVWTQNTPRLCN